MDLCWQSNVSAFNTLSRLVITFLPRSKCLLISWLQSPSAVILETPKHNRSLVDHQAPLSMEFSKQEYWRGLPFPPPGDLPNPGIKLMSPVSPALAGGFFTIQPPRKAMLPHHLCLFHQDLCPRQFPRVFPQVLD